MIEQLKNGVNAMRMPVEDLASNWAYMVMTALAWNLKAWYGLLLPNRERGIELVRMEPFDPFGCAQGTRKLRASSLPRRFRRFLHTIVLLPAQIVPFDKLRAWRRTGRRIIYRIMGYNDWLKDFFAAWERIRRMAVP